MSKNKKMISQRDYMRKLYKKFSSRKTIIIQTYANGECEGIVERKRNTFKLSPEAYAQALFSDGIRRGWIKG